MDTTQPKEIPKKVPAYTKPIQVIKVDILDLKNLESLEEKSSENVKLDITIGLLEKEILTKLGSILSVINPSKIEQLRIIRRNKSLSLLEMTLLSELLKQCGHITNIFI